MLCKMVGGKQLYMYNMTPSLMLKNTFKCLNADKPKNCYYFPLCEITCAYVLCILFDFDLLHFF